MEKSVWIFYLKDGLHYGCDSIPLFYSLLSKTESAFNINRLSSGFVALVLTVSWLLLWLKDAVLLPTHKHLIHLRGFRHPVWLPTVSAEGPLSLLGWCQSATPLSVYWSAPLGQHLSDDIFKRLPRYGISQRDLKTFASWNLRFCCLLLLSIEGKNHTDNTMEISKEEKKSSRPLKITVILESACNKSKQVRMQRVFQDSSASSCHASKPHLKRCTENVFYYDLDIIQV